MRVRCNGADPVKRVEGSQIRMRFLHPLHLSLEMLRDLTLIAGIRIYDFLLALIQMSPTGIEPAQLVPETSALSTELRGLQQE